MYHWIQLIGSREGPVLAIDESGNLKEDPVNLETKAVQKSGRESKYFVRVSGKHYCFNYFLEKFSVRI